MNDAIKVTAKTHLLKGVQSKTQNMIEKVKQMENFTKYRDAVTKLVF